MIAPARRLRCLKPSCNEIRIPTILPKLDGQYPSQPSTTDVSTGSFTSHAFETLSARGISHVIVYVAGTIFDSRMAIKVDSFCTDCR